MATDSMARQVLFLISFLLIVNSCKLKNDNINRMYNSKQKGFEFKNGVLLKNNNLFTGTVCVVNSKNDTTEIQQYLGGKEHGVWKKFYKSHKLQEVRHYNNGIKTDELISFWPNGKKKQLYKFDVNGDYQGTCQVWNTNGVLIQEMNYEHGHEEGSQKLYYDNGKVRANYVIKNGRRYGLLGTKNCVNTNEIFF